MNAVNEPVSTTNASLEDVMTGEMHGFPDLAALLGYLEALGCANQQEGEARLEGQPE